jgi:hypothetical protein
MELRQERMVQMRRVVERCHDSGESGVSFARAQGVAPSTLFRWQRRVTEERLARTDPSAPVTWRCCPSRSCRPRRSQAMRSRCCWRPGTASGGWVARHSLMSAPSGCPCCGRVDQSAFHCCRSVRVRTRAASLRGPAMSISMNRVLLQATIAKVLPVSRSMTLPVMGAAVSILNAAFVAG